MSSLYSKYIKEREQKEIIEKDWGFVSYKINGPEIYLADIYVRPDQRSLGRSRELVNEVIEVGKNANCEILTANIHCADPNVNKTLIVSLHLGFEVKGANNGVILIAINLKGEK